MVISRVPQEFTEYIIKEDSGAVNVRRITKMVDGRVVETNTIILAYEDTAPKEVFINLQRFNTSTYVPTPIRCNKCQLFGHKTIQCNKSDAVCPRCSARDHHFANCPAQNTEVKCANCGGNHNVAYRGCPKYKQVRDILTISAKHGMSYRDAAVEWKEKAKCQDITTSQQNLSSTSNQQLSQSVQTTKISIGTQTSETTLPENVLHTTATNTDVTAASASRQTCDDLTNDQLLCLLNTTTTALFWLVKQIPPTTTGHDQIVQQLTIVMNVMKKQRTIVSTEDQCVSAKSKTAIQHDPIKANSHHSANLVAADQTVGENCTYGDRTTPLIM